MRTNIILTSGLILCLAITSCKEPSNNSKPNLTDSLSEKENSGTNSHKLYYATSGYAYTLPDSIGGKPIAFYIENPEVADIAKQLYLNKFKPTDNDSTTMLLSLAVDKDSLLRPFYLWCLDFVIQISDGALGEYPGEPAFNYATTYPTEFFAYMDKDTTGIRYKWWTEIIAYSGVNQTISNEKQQKNQIITSMIKNCSNCNTSTKRRIEKFANDIIKATHLAD